VRHVALQFRGSLERSWAFRIASSSVATDSSCCVDRGEDSAADGKGAVRVSDQVSAARPPVAVLPRTSYCLLAGEQVEAVSGSHKDRQLAHPSFSS